MARLGVLLKPPSPNAQCCPLCCAHSAHDANNAHAAVHFQLLLSASNAFPVALLAAIAISKYDAGDGLHNTQAQV
jgi:hypothetical protein